MADLVDCGTGCIDVATEKCGTAETCCALIPLFGLVLMLCLFVNPDYPAFSVEQFYVSAFNKTASNATSNTISFDIKLLNRNTAIALYYEGPVNVTFSFVPRETSNKIIWEYSVPKFYQGNAQSRRLRDVIKPVGTPDIPVFNQTVVAEHLMALPTGAIMTGFERLVYFRVEITTKVKLKLVGKHHAKDIALGANVPISATTGEKFAYSGIRANAEAAIGWGATQSAVMIVLSTVINLIFM